LKTEFEFKFRVDHFSEFNEKRSRKKFLIAH
jgi:hypothetical protein